MSAALARALTLATATLGAVVLVAAFATADRRSPEASAQPASLTPSGGIANIAAFLDQCPANDPAYAQMRADFEIRKEGAVVGAIGCSEPVSAMPLAQVTDELIAVQALRTIYYMEGGRSVPYPWTSGSFYDWMKAKIGGVDIRAGRSSCCEQFNGKWFVVIDAESPVGRDGSREWRGLSDRIALLGHETRHVDGFPHVGGCPLFPTGSFGCDQTYDPNNPSAYGVQWWLHAKWLSGDINIGYACLESNVVLSIATSHLNTANNYRSRFVTSSERVAAVASDRTQRSRMVGNRVLNKREGITLCVKTGCIRWYLDICYTVKPWARASGRYTCIWKLLCDVVGL